MKDRGRAEGHTSRRWWPATIGAAGVILLAALLFWPSSPKVREPARRARPASAAQTKPVDAPLARSDSSAPKQLVTVHQKPQAEVNEVRAEDDDAHEGYINPPDPTEEGHPHPHTPEHERIFHENNVIGQLNGAMDVGDFIGMRRLNAEYRKEYPEDGHLLQEGFDIIADCLEELTAERRARARRFWQTERGSQLRRYVRRHCLSEQ